MNSSSSLSLGKTSLNPHAREFVPTVLRSSTVVATAAGSGSETEPSASSDSGKTSLQECATDEECRKYWSAQLPDDILSLEDFFAQDVESSESITASSHVSAHDASVFTEISDDQSAQWEKTMLSGKSIQTSSQIPEFGYSHVERSSARTANKTWDNDQDMTSRQLTSSPFGWNSQPFNGVPSENLAEIYQPKGGDVNLTSGILSQLKLRDDENPCQNMSLPSSLTNVSARKTAYNGVFTNHVEEQQQMEEFIRLMRTNKTPYLHDKNGVGFGNHPRLSNLIQHGEYFSADFPFMNEARPAMQQNYQIPSRHLLETDDAYVTLIGELQEKAQDHARIRDAFFEQAQQAYFVGDKVLVRDATAKGQLHNKLMKLAQSKAAELVFQHRNMSSSQTPSIGPGQTQLLDLRGIHVNEAVILLRQELYGLRMLARSSNQHQQVFISVGTGYTKGHRAPSRLLSAVKRHLIENEFLNFTEPQPGIIRVVLN